MALIRHVDVGLCVSTVVRICQKARPVVVWLIMLMVFCSFSSSFYFSVIFLNHTFSFYMYCTEICIIPIGLLVLTSIVILRRRFGYHATA